MSEIAAKLERLGAAASPVVTLDGVPADWPGLIDAAAAMHPFPAAQGIYYPGLRRIFTPRDTAAWEPTAALLEACAPYIAGAFDCDGFTVAEANFSLVTTPAAALLRPQRHPHFDSVDPDFIALIAYLFADGEGHGTAFYRQASTGIEVVDEGNRQSFIASAQVEPRLLSGYFSPGSPGYVPIGQVDAACGRIGIWRGNLLHSGLVPTAHDFSSDPRRGRLTLNLFLQLTRG